MQIVVYYCTTLTTSPLSFFRSVAARAHRGQGQSRALGLAPLPRIIVRRRGTNLISPYLSRGEGPGALSLGSQDLLSTWLEVGLALYVDSTHPNRWGLSSVLGVWELYHADKSLSPPAMTTFSPTSDKRSSYLKFPLRLTHPNNV